MLSAADGAARRRVCTGRKGRSDLCGTHPYVTKFPDACSLLACMFAARAAWTRAARARFAPAARCLSTCSAVTDLSGGAPPPPAAPSRGEVATRAFCRRLSAKRIASSA